jgi:hypothetical protein
MKALLQDLEAFVADRQWERAAIYFDDLHAQALGASGNARMLSAMLHTLLGLQAAIDRHDTGVAIGALRHLGWLADGSAHQPHA